MKQKAILVLENGEVFHGQSFGFQGECVADLIFNTNMMGYQEVLTDPAYCNHIIVMTYPLIGNYGINKKDMNSKRAYAVGLIVKEYSKITSNWQAEDSLSGFMKENKVIGIEGVDTRYLARIIKEHGIQRGVISTKGSNIKRLINKIKKETDKDLVKIVSCKETYQWQKSKTNKKLAVVIDLGTSFSFLDWLSGNNFKVKILPYNTDYERIIKLNPELIVFSNGPGDPLAYKSIINKAQKLIGKIPIFGFGLGQLILGVTLGAKSYKMKCGHHGSNYAIRDILQNKLYITAQDHTFCLKNNSLKGDNKIVSLNINDETVEGFQNKKKKVLGLHYLPSVLK